MYLANWGIVFYRKDREMIWNIAIKPLVVVVGLMNFSGYVSAATAPSCGDRVMAAAREVWEEYRPLRYEFAAVRTMKDLFEHLKRLNEPIVKLQYAAGNPDDLVGEYHLVAHKKVLNGRKATVIDSLKNHGCCMGPVKNCVMSRTTRMFREGQFSLITVPVPTGYDVVPSSVGVVLYDHERHIDIGEARGIVLDYDTAENKGVLRRARRGEEPTIFSLWLNRTVLNGTDVSFWKLRAYSSDARFHGRPFELDLHISRRFIVGQAPSAVGAARI